MLNAGGIPKFKVELKKNMSTQIVVFLRFEISLKEHPTLLFINIFSECWMTQPLTFDIGLLS